MANVKCEVCKDIFDTKHGMLTHKSMKHGKPTKECKVCGDTFTHQPARNNAKYCSEDCQYKSLEVDKVSVDCDNCEEIVMKYPREIDKYEKLFCSTDCRHNYFTKENHPRYTGYTSENFYGVSWDSWRNKILDKYNNCQRCGENAEQVHHIKPVNEFTQVQDAHYEDNLTLLCASCHMIVENNWNIERQKNKLL